MGGSAKFRTGKKIANAKMPQNDKFTEFLNMTNQEKADYLKNVFNMDFNSLPSELQAGGEVEAETQKLVYALGLNDKPTVMSKSEFDNYLKENNMSDKDIITRSVNNDKVLESWMDSDLNYVGGRGGKSFYGSGTYFAHTYGNKTQYGKYSMNAVIKKDAKIVSTDVLTNIMKSTPQEIKDVIGKMPFGKFGKKSIYALMAGYQGILDPQTKYVTIIDRSAVVVNKDIF